MSDDTQGGGFGRKKAFPKTFGDVMKGIPAGKGGERGDRRGGPGEGRPPRQDAERKSEGRGDQKGGERGRKDRKGRPEERKGPVVVRKPAPLGLKKDEGEATAPAATMPPPAAETQEHKGEPKRAPKTVFRRSDGLNLPPREAAEASAEASPAPASAAAAAPAPMVEAPPDEDFAEMLAQSEQGATPKRFEVGEKVAGRIIQFGQDRAFLDLGGKGEGMIELKELRDSHGELIVALGEVIEGYVLSTAGGIIVTKQLTKGAQREFLQEARAAGIPVEGVVTGLNKGGLEVDLGGMRGFCPISQIDVHFVENPAEMVGQRLSFKVTELKDRDIVLSRRALLEAEAAVKAQALREQLRVGLQLDGKVTSLREFGAFVDLGGLEGLLHVSELGYGRVGHPKEVLELGQLVRVEVVRIDPPKEGEKAERIALSMKSMQQDPWQQAAAALHEGDQVRGKVVRLQPFGAFVEIQPGVDGLVHISALGATRRIAHPKEVVSEGEELLCVVESVDPEQKRISLRRITGEEPLEAPQAAAQPAGGPPKVGDVVEATVDKVETFGIFVRFPAGRGLIPNAEMGTPKGADHRRLYPPGSTIKAAIIEIDNQGRLRLSKTAAENAAERQEYNQFMRKQQEKSSGKGFGTLGDLLKLKK